MGKQLRSAGLAAALTVAAGLASVAPARAGEIYGTISERGVSRPGLPLTLQCEGGPRTEGKTDSFGAYRLFVGFQGLCRLSAPGIEAAVVRSAGEAQRYNLEIVRPAGGPATLRRR